jgi:hypothetical protein
MRKREIWLPDKIDDMALAQAEAMGIDISVFYAGLLSDHLLKVEAKSIRANLRGGKLIAEAVAIMDAAGIPEPGPGPLWHPDDKFDPEGWTYSSSRGVQRREVAGFVRNLSDPDRPPHECDQGYFRYVGRGKGDYHLTDNTGEDPDSSPPFLGTFEEAGPGQGDYVMTVGFSHLSLDVAKMFPGFPVRSIRYAQRVVNAATEIPGVVPSEYKLKNGQKIGIAFKPNFLMIEALLQRKSGIRVSIYGEPDQFNSKPSSLGRGRGRYSRIVVKSDDDLENLLPLVRQAYEFKLGPVPALSGDEIG